MKKLRVSRGHFGLVRGAVEDAGFAVASGDGRRAASIVTAQRGFSKGETSKIIHAVLNDEGQPPASMFDFVQGITRVARDKQHQDVRLELKGKAKKLLDLTH